MSDRRNEPEPLAPLTPEQVAARLDYEFPEMLRRRDELLEALKAFLSVHPIIESEEAQGRAAENRRMARELATTAEAQRTVAKAPYLAAGRAVDGWFARATDPLTEPLAELAARMTDFGVRLETEKRRQAEEAAAAARELANRKAEEAAASMTDEAISLAAAAEQAAQGAEQMAAAKPADLSRVRGEFGAIASVRRAWKWRETNHDLVPRNLMDVSPAKVNAAIKLAGRDKDGVPRAKIPGIEIYEVRSV